MLITQQEDTLDISNPYNMFKYSIRNEPILPYIPDKIMTAKITKITM